ncbi:MAG: hypothetical protein LRY52_02390 [Sulfurospirillum cavolei]|nr:hypothetical protein [Sulfurospirillum cavolei]
MYVHESGVGYTLYIQNDYYANQTLKESNTLDSGQNLTNETYDASLDDYLNKIIDSIPELKSAQESGVGIGVVILPQSASSTLKEAVSQTTNKMLDEGTDEDVLKSVLGIVKFNYSADVEYGSGVATVKNDTYSYDLESVNNILSKFQEIYGSNGNLSAGLSKFSEYLNDIYTNLTNAANPNTSMEDTTSSSNDNTGTDLVETFIQELNKSENGTTDSTEELNKKLYKNYIKSLSSSLTGGLLQQTT